MILICSLLYYSNGGSSNRADGNNTGGATDRTSNRAATLAEGLDQLTALFDPRSLDMVTDKQINYSLKLCCLLCLCT